MKSLASDNYASVCPEVMAFLAEINQGHSPAYGQDRYTARAIDAVRRALAVAHADIYFVYNGTAANTLALNALMRSHHSVICTDMSHLVHHEVAAVPAHVGCKLLIAPSDEHGKLTVAALEKVYQEETFWGGHATQPKVVSIAQVTECGTVYTLEELDAIAVACRRLSLYLHIDGCRLYNAAVALNCSLHDLVKHADVLSLGGTKNGLMMAEAIVFLRPSLSEEFEFLQKQGLQLQSKMRYLAGQYIPFFEKNLWEKHAKKANEMCSYLQQRFEQIGYVNFVYPVESNHLFMQLPPDKIEKTSQVTPYHLFDEKTNTIRLVTSFDTTTQDIDLFFKALMA